MGSWLADVATHDAWALWLAAPALGIALVCVGVWWWSRPARPATTARAIEGHHAYLEALTRGPRERGAAPAAGGVGAAGAPLAHPVVLDATVLDAEVLDAAAHGPEGGGADGATTVTVHA